MLFFSHIIYDTKTTDKLKKLVKSYPQSVFDLN